jgi:ABC-type multidrug transport system fused ATPase/permease subunit
MTAERIVVMDGGRVAEAGTHAELLARGGIYRRVHDMQSASGAGETA